MLIDGLTGPRRSLGRLRALVEAGERTTVSTLVLYEWLRGPRTAQELEDQERIFPADAAQPFGSREALLAAELYRRVRRARARAFDLAVAASAIAAGARLWTLNERDFGDVPGLQLLR